MRCRTNSELSHDPPFTGCPRWPGITHQEYILRLRDFRMRPDNRNIPHSVYARKPRRLEQALSPTQTSPFNEIANSDAT